jgi:hypothetical protein
VSVSGLEGHEIIEPEIIDARFANASDARQRSGRLHFDDALEGPPELPT